MFKIGEIRRGKELGYASPSNSYIRQLCKQCGKERWVLLKNGEPIHHLCLFCSNKQKPAPPHYRGSKHPRWKGGRTKGWKGYIFVQLQPDDFFYPMTKRAGVVLEHRLVVAKALGRCLHSWEIVHHKGAKYPKGSIENKQDNRYPENLQLVSDIGHKQLTLLEKQIKRLKAENQALRKKLKIS